MVSLCERRTIHSAAHGGGSAAAVTVGWMSRPISLGTSLVLDKLATHRYKWKARQREGMLLLQTTSFAVVNLHGLESCYTQTTSFMGHGMYYGIKIDKY